MTSSVPPARLACPVNRPPADPGSGFRTPGGPAWPWLGSKRGDLKKLRRAYGSGVRASGPSNLCDLPASTRSVISRAAEIIPRIFRIRTALGVASIGTSMPRCWAGHPASLSRLPLAIKPAVTDGASVEVDRRAVGVPSERGEVRDRGRKPWEVELFL